jgi:dienelactone hydrolase
MKIHILLLSLFTLTSLSAKATLVKKDVEYKLAGKTFEGYVAYDDAKKGPLPGILVTHDWLGVTDKTKASVDKLAELGYIAFAVDVYGKTERPKNPEEAGAMAGKFKKDRVLLRARMQQGLKTLRDMTQTDKSRIAVIGYCFGGTAAIELARTGANLKSVVSFHGGLDSPKPEDGKRIKAHILALHGADDPFEAAADLAAFEDEMRKSKVDWELVKYGGAVHAFTDKSLGTDNSKGAAYNAEADKRSWMAMENFLKETL